MKTHPDACMNGADLAVVLHKTFGSAPAGIIFDCDGVLADSNDANIHYYNLLRKGLGLPPMSEEQERYVHMSTVEEAFERIIPKALFPALRDVVSNIPYLDEIQPLMKPMPGVRAFTEACKENGMFLAIHTNRSGSILPLLLQFGMAQLFDPVVSALDARPKPDPQGALFILDKWRLPGERVLFVGDSSTDRLAARGAGIPFLAFGDQEPSDMGCCASFKEFLTAMQIMWDSNRK